MAGLKETFDELRAVWDAVPADKRAAAGEQATVAALMAGDALRILRDHMTALSGPAVAAGTKAIMAGMLWRVPLSEIFGCLETVFPELVAVLKRIGAELGFEETPAPAPPVTPTP
jgi:hypothetical protein